MKIMLLQVFGMLIAAYLLGALVACLFKRNVIGREARHAVPADRSASRR